ncbi:MAG: hypothetical protein U0525_00180 [Patescibacteria group bacterium]
MQKHHYLYLAIVMFGVAVVSGLVFYFTSLRLVIKNNSISIETKNEINQEQETKVKFVPVDPENPVALPKGTVGGMTACERIDNLIDCLGMKNKNLQQLVKDEIASKGATIEETCGNKMNAIMKYRMESIKSECVF